MPCGWQRLNGGEAYRESLLDSPLNCKIQLVRIDAGGWQKRQSSFSIWSTHQFELIFHFYAFQIALLSAYVCGCFRSRRVHFPGGGGLCRRTVGIKGRRYDLGGEWDPVHCHRTRGGSKGDYRVVIFLVAGVHLERLGRDRVLQFLKGD